MTDISLKKKYKWTTIFSVLSVVSDSVPIEDNLERLQKFKTELSYDPKILTLGIYAENKLHKL